MGALNEFRQKELCEDVLLALSDPEPEVQANALRQLRERRIPGAIDRLLDALDNPHEKVQQAVRESLSEFNFMRYMAAFDKLTDEVKQSTGKLVFRLDQSTLPTLRQEFTSQWRKRRVRAVDIAQAMQIAPLVETELLALLQDPDHFLVMRVIDTLAECQTSNAKEALEELLSGADNVKLAAETALQKQREAPPPGTESKSPRAPLEPLPDVGSDYMTGATSE